jgi:hypothetical protein
LKASRKKPNACCKALGFYIADISIKQMAEILVAAKNRADAGELTVLKRRKSQSSRHHFEWRPAPGKDTNTYFIEILVE